MVGNLKLFECLVVCFLTPLDLGAGSYDSQIS